MKRSRFSDTQIVSILKQAEAGVPVKEVCRQHQISSACYYKWKSKFGGLSVSELRRNRELEAENSKLKRMYAEMAMENHALKDLIEKSSRVVAETCGRGISSRATLPVDPQGLRQHRTVSIGLVSAAGGLDRTRQCGCRGAQRIG